MVNILMMLAKIATPDFLKIKVFLSMTSPTTFCYMTQIILWMWSCDQSLIAVAFAWEKLS